MAASALQSLDEIAGEYCRRARKIRAQSRGNPRKIHEQLRQLFHPTPSAAPQKNETVSPPFRVGNIHPLLSRNHPPVDWSASAVLGHRAAAARNFADLVAARLVGTILPWTDRQSLLREAARRQINRFEANLIIAAVQHHLHTGHHPAPLPPEKNHAALRFIAWIAAMATVEAIIVLAVWRLAC